MAPIKTTLNNQEEVDKPPSLNLNPNLSQIGQVSGFVDQLSFKLVTKIDECEFFWRQFSPNICLFDTWDFRLAFWQAYQHQPYFIVVKRQSQTVGLLPLWYELDRKKYFWFGSWWQEENKFLVKDPNLIPVLLSVCPSPAVLNAISPEYLPSNIVNQFGFRADDPKYILNLSGIKNANDYLKTLKKKKRYNLKRDRQTISLQRPQILVNNFSDFDHLVALSKARFKQKGESTDWEDCRRVQAFKNVIKLGQKKRSFKTRMLTVLINNQVAAVDLIAIYNQCYYPLKCGYNVKSFSGIGNFLNLLEIDDASSLGMKKLDFLEIGYGWKDKWFEAKPLLTYET